MEFDFDSPSLFHQSVTHFHHWSDVQSEISTDVECCINFEMTWSWRSLLQKDEKAMLSVDLFLFLYAAFMCVPLAGFWSGVQRFSYWASVLLHLCLFVINIVSMEQNFDADNASFSENTGKKQTGFWESAPWSWMETWSGVKGQFQLLINRPVRSFWRGDFPDNVVIRVGGCCARILNEYNKLLGYYVVLMSSCSIEMIA